MVLRSPDRIATLQEALDGAGELAAVGVEDGKVLQSGVPLRRGCATLAVPRVQTYVVVVIPGGKKGGSRQAEVGTVWGTRDEATLEELFAPDFVHHGALPGQTPDREGHKQTLAMFRSAFPDLNVTTEDIIAEGKAVSRWTARGTHQGELMGIAPTGNEVTFTGIEVLRIAEGKVVERWAETNDLEVMQQIGAIPEPGQSDEASPT